MLFSAKFLYICSERNKNDIIYDLFQETGDDREQD